MGRQRRGRAHPCSLDSEHLGHHSRSPIVGDDDLRWGPAYGITGSFLVPNDDPRARRTGAVSAEVRETPRMAFRTIYIPESSFDLDESETGILVEELRLVERDGARFDAASLADKIGGASAAPIELTDAELGALYRALENLRWCDRLAPHEGLKRLHYNVAQVAGVPLVEYELFLIGGDVSVKTIPSWTSYSGVLEPGDRICIPDGAWRVIEVEQRPVGQERLVCQPYADDYPPYRYTPPGF
jgi:hypothetical protein